MDFEWDTTKAAGNRSKHGVSFDEASDLFGDAPIIGFDDGHSTDEERFIAVGVSTKNRVLVVSLMAKIKHKTVKFSPEEMAYELPDEVNLKKLRRAGSGIETVKRLAARSKRTIGLDPDVAKVFPDSEAVNGMLRAIISSMPK